MRVFHTGCCAVDAQRDGCGMKLDQVVWLQNRVLSLEDEVERLREEAKGLAYRVEQLTDERALLWKQVAHQREEEE